jgi:hypothetical protein
MRSRSAPGLWEHGRSGLAGRPTDKNQLGAGPQPRERAGFPLGRGSKAGCRPSKGPPAPRRRSIPPAPCRATGAATAAGTADGADASPPSPPSSSAADAPPRPASPQTADVPRRKDVSRRALLRRGCSTGCFHNGEHDFKFTHGQNDLEFDLLSLVIIGRRSIARKACCALGIMARCAVWKPVAPSGPGTGHRRLFDVG